MCCGIENHSDGVTLDAESTLGGEEATPKTKEQVKEVNGGMALLSDLCFAKRSDPLGLVRGLREVVTCVYGPELTYAFHDPLGVPTLGSACELD